MSKKKQPEIADAIVQAFWNATAGYMDSVKHQEMWAAIENSTRTEVLQILASKTK